MPREGEKKPYQKQRLGISKTKDLRHPEARFPLLAQVAMARCCGHGHYCSFASVLMLKASRTRCDSCIWTRTKRFWSCRDLNIRWTTLIHSFWWGQWDPKIPKNMCFTTGDVSMIFHYFERRDDAMDWFSFGGRENPLQCVFDP